MKNRHAVFSILVIVFWGFLAKNEVMSQNEPACINDETFRAIKRKAIASASHGRGETLDTTYFKFVPVYECRQTLMFVHPDGLDCSTLDLCEVLIFDSKSNKIKGSIGICGNDKLAVNSVSRQIMPTMPCQLSDRKYTVPTSFYRKIKPLIRKLSTSGNVMLLHDKLLGLRFFQQDVGFTTIE